MLVVAGLGENGLIEGTLIGLLINLNWHVTINEQRREADQDLKEVFFADVWGVRSGYSRISETVICEIVDRSLPKRGFI